MDTLTRSSRISYCCAFGATAFLVYVILLEHRFAIEYDGPIALKSLIAVLSMFVYGMVFFPVFASLALATAFSYLLGSLYVWMFLVVDIYKLTECSITAVARAILFVRAIPSLLCLGYLSLSLPLRFCLACRERRFITSSVERESQVETLDDIKQSYQGKHVSKLLRKPEMAVQTVGVVNKIRAVILGRLRRIFYHRQGGFRYPSRLVSVMFIAGCVVYVLTVEFLVKFTSYIDLIEEYVESQLQALGLDDEDEDYPTDPDEPPASIQFGILLAQVLLGIDCLFTYSFDPIMSLKTNLMAVYKGDYSHIPSPSTKSASSLCLGSMKYAGFQVAYIVWAYIISCLIIFIICINLSVIILLLLNGITDWLINKVLQIWRFYFIFTYFMFFYNIFLGLISCLMRIIKAMIVGTLFLARLDNSTLPRKFEFLDPGFSAYQGYIHMEAAHTHPVVLVFIRLLVSLSKSRKMGDGDCVKIDMSKTDETATGPDSKQNGNVKDIENCRPVNIAARFNWHVTYTLLLNPQVRLYRKGVFQAMKKAVAEGRKIPISDKPLTDFDLIKTQEEREQERLDEVNKLQGSQAKKGKFSGFSFGRGSVNNSTSSKDEKGSPKKKKKHFWFGNKKKNVSSEVMNSMSIDEKECEMVVLQNEEEEGSAVEDEEISCANGTNEDQKNAQDTVIDVDINAGAVNI
ncbi:hypothetical protein Btru_029567 [Bulinus truncatus]|nr:hypothetical protein Btru_029567 [Bulinus truncatus]